MLKTFSFHQLLLWMSKVLFNVLDTHYSESVSVIK